MLGALFVFVVALQWAVITAWPPGDTGGWQDVTTDVFSSSSLPYPVRAATLIDWNNDKSVDMVTIGLADPSGNASFTDTLQVWVWDASTHSFSVALTSPHLSTISGTTGDYISNLASGDINRDGMNDIVVLMGSGAIVVLDGSAPGNFSLVPVSIKTKNGFDDAVDGSIPQISLLNVFGSCALLDIALVTTSRNLVVLRLNSDEAQHSASCNFVGGPLVFRSQLIIDTEDVVPLRLSTLDVNGDCNAQLVYARRNAANMSFYSWDSVSSVSSYLTSVPLYAGVPTSIDINSDGVGDLIFPFCSQDDVDCQSSSASGSFSAMLFVYGSAGNGAPACGQYDCCNGFLTTFASAIPIGATGTGVGYAVVDVHRLQGCESLQGFPKQSSADKFGMPLVLRTGDFNRDSLQDIAVPSSLGPLILQATSNDPGSVAFLCSPLFQSLSTRDSGAPAAAAVPFFFDIEEDGRLDVIVINNGWHLSSASATSKSVGFSALWNGLTMHEEYFLTALVLNGVNPSFAPAGAASGGVAFPSWGASQIGAVHRFQWQDIEMNVHTVTAVQFASTACFALENPRVHFGLGKTFSYVQNYAAGIHFMPLAGPALPTSTSMHHTWPSYLIPNSQVVAIPFPLTDPLQWSIKLFLSSSKYQTLLLISLCTALVVIGVPIVVLKVREVREDMAEMKRHY